MKDSDRFVMNANESDIGINRFHPWQLRTVIDEAMTRWPGCTFSRAGNGIQNLCVYDYDGNYVGVISLRTPELIVLEVYDDDGTEDEGDT